MSFRRPAWLNGLKLPGASPIGSVRLRTPTIGRTALPDASTYSKLNSSLVSAAILRRPSRPAKFAPGWLIRMVSGLVWSAGKISPQEVVPRTLGRSAAQLGQQVVGDRRVELPPGVGRIARGQIGDGDPQRSSQGQQDDEAADEDESGPGDDGAAEAFPERAGPAGGGAQAAVRSAVAVCGRRTPNGQKSSRPLPRSSAGASVTHATSVTSRHTAMAGPLLRNLPKSAKTIMARPKMVVSALAARALPTWPSARAAACGVVESSLQFFLVSRDEEQAEIGAGAVENHDDEDPRGLEDLEVEPGERVARLRGHGHQIRRQPDRHADRHQRHQHQARRAIDEQQDENDHEDRRPFGVADALLGREEHVGADGRRAGHAQPAARRESRRCVRFRPACW